MSGLMRPSKLRLPDSTDDDGEIALVDGVADLGDQGSGVADAGGAAVADEVEPELVEVRREAGLLEVVGHDLRAGRQGGLDPRLAGQALLDRVLGQQGGTDHDRGVRRVGAGRDGGDRDGAVVELELRAVLHGDVLRVAGASAVLGGARQVVAGGRLAMSRAVGWRIRGWERLLERLVPFPIDCWLIVVDVGRQRSTERSLRVGDRDAVLRALGAGDRRDHLGEVELQLLGEARLLLGVVPQALGLGVGLGQRDLLLATTGELHVLGGLVVDREDRDGGAVLGAHVADRGAVGERHGADARLRRTRRTCRRRRARAASR